MRGGNTIPRKPLLSNRPPALDRGQFELEVKVKNTGNHLIWHSIYRYSL
jgi:hypothetical protein